MQAKRRGIFWSIVAECLMRFFDYERESAVSTVLDFQRRLRDAPIETNPDVVYHEEPFTVAKNLAGRPDAALAEYRAPYERLVEQITQNYGHRKDSILYDPLTHEPPTR